MPNSMTGFAALAGEDANWRWNWDIRSVNGRGRDLRLRLPDWLDGVDQPARALLTKAVARGSVTLGLKLQRTEGGASESLDQAALDQALAHLRAVEHAASDAGVALTPSRAADILGLRGVIRATDASDDTTAIAAAVLDRLPEVVAAFNQMRAAEGAALAEILTKQLDDILALTEEAATVAEARKAAWADRLRQNLDRVLANAEGADPDRVAQELAMIAVKSDVTEELDRLRSHVGAARDLLRAEEPVGRKLDFLSQEFNREANTLCSKAQAPELTRIGLDLKAVIDQMREQIQNVE